jgi:ADP-heptose:LPS heptosyltransferase
MSRRLVVRLDNVGDVLLAGPAVRAVSRTAGHLAFVAGSSSAEAAGLLPGVDTVITFDAPWVPFDAPPVDPSAVTAFVEQIGAGGFDEAIVLTSFHQSPLPIALLLRLAGVGRICATSVDYPGSLLDVRHPYDESLHEVEQALSLCNAAGHHLGDDDDARLAIELGRGEPTTGDAYIVVHPGASVPARALPVSPTAEVVTRLAASGMRVVLTGSARESCLARHLTAGADPERVSVLCGETSVAEFAAVVAGAEVVVCGNTSAAHIAAAVGTPVVEAFAPVVPAHRWRPWRVPHVLLGMLDIGCAGCRARICPIKGQPCLAPFTADHVLAAIERLRTGEDRRISASRVGVS